METGAVQNALLLLPAGLVQQSSQSGTKELQVLLADHIQTNNV
jgi:hypothetical protein